MIPKPSHYFMGIDPAPAIGIRSDDGVLVVLRASLKDSVEGLISVNAGDYKLEYVWAYRCRAMSGREWSGKIHQTQQRFSLTGICMDPNGGGNMIALEMNRTRQLIAGIECDCTPICCPGDALASAAFILSLFKRGDRGIERLYPHLVGDDNLVDAQHVRMQEAIELGLLAMPVPWDERSNEERRRLEQTWSPEQIWALKMLSIGMHQLMGIQVATKDDGSWVFTRHGARQFFATGKKDCAYAMCYAYLAFLIWMSGGELDGMEHNEAMSYVL